MFEEFFKEFTSESQLQKKYKQLVYFFVHECGWSQEDFDNAEIEFMNDVLDEADRIAKKSNKKK